MAPTKPANISIEKSELDTYLAMLDLLPVQMWLDLYDQVKGTMYYPYQLQYCTTFTLGDDQ